MFGRRRKISVTLETFGLASRLVRGGTYQIKEGGTLRALLKKAGVPRDAPLAFMIDGERLELGRVLENGQVINALLLTGGG